MTALKAPLFLLSLAIASFAASSVCLAADTYLGTTIDTVGDLRIQRTKGPDIIVEKEAGQVGFDKIAISKDGGSIGWLALYENCCTSYPIPLKLILYSRGHARTFVGRSLPIWRWHFTADGRQFAFEQETVHGGIGIHYELRDLASGRLIAEYDPPAPDDGPPSTRELPAWVAALEASL